MSRRVLLLVVVLLALTGCKGQPEMREEDWQAIRDAGPGSIACFCPGVTNALTGRISPACCTPAPEPDLDEQLNRCIQDRDMYHRQWLELNDLLLSGAP